MTIVFATTQSASGSTLIGRTIPIAEHLAKKHDVHLLAFTPLPKISRITCHPSGRNPFIRTPSGKKRLRSFPLLANMLNSAFIINWHLWRINPDLVIITKTMPHNVLGVRLWHLFHSSRNIIVDVDDFELTANHLTSLWQRAAIHWAQRCSARMATHIITATPFLSDYFSNLRPQSKVSLIPTGIYPQPIPQYSIEPTLTYLGSVSISSGHRVDLLPSVMAHLIKSYPHAKLIIAGTGDDEVKLKQAFAARHLSSSVVWHGRFTNDDLAMLLSKTSIIIDPIDSSIANRAKSSFRVALAVSVGLPVVTSNVGLRPWLIPHSLHDRFFAQPNPTQLAKTIAALLARPLSSADRLSLISHARRFYWSKLAADYQSIITS